MKTRPDFKQARHAPIQLDAPERRLSDARKDLEQRRLARAVASDDADDLTRRDLEVEIFHGPERGRLVAVLAQRAHGPAREVHERLAQCRVGETSTTKLVLLAEPLHSDDRLHQM